MQKWEYTSIRTFGGVVVLVNGQDVAKMVGAQPVGEMLYEYLEAAGQDGWEVVGMAGVRDGTEIILKRPKVDELAAESAEGAQTEPEAV